MDGGEIDVWLGTAGGKQVNGIVCTVDRMKRDSEIKLLIGCTAEEKTIVCIVVLIPLNRFIRHVRITLSVIFFISLFFLSYHPLCPAARAKGTFCPAFHHTNRTFQGEETCQNGDFYAMIGIAFIE